MNDLQELRIWVEIELKQARFNQSESKQAPNGFYHSYNSGRESALRGVLDKIDVLLSNAESII